MGKDGGVANTNILWHAGKLMALEEGHMPFEVDPRTLDSHGYVTEYRGRVTAHPKIDPDTGEMVWFGYSTGETPLNATVSYGVTDVAGNVVRRDDFQVPYSSMVHDFLVTGDHALFPILPLTGSLQRAMSGGPAYAWEPDKGARLVRWTLDLSDQTNQIGPSALLGHRYTVAAARAQPAGSFNGMQPSASRTSPSDQT